MEEEKQANTEHRVPTTVNHTTVSTEKAPIETMYQDWFLEYASYVILERAVPAIEDGLKPVQRRILHAMYTIDDGRYNKVANIVGQTMQYHPHGDASITEAIVGMGQKELLIDTQGNWGDVRTGDSAAAARYIEARLSSFGKEVLYSPAITTWQLAYDGRKKEPRTLPIKFPLLLAQGVEGIAVGLATRILPHNFVELLEASIDWIQGRPITLFPDFPTGGLVDCSQYNGGKRGGKIRIRATIKAQNAHTLVVTEIPYGTTTLGVIDSILKAHEKGKIKIKNVVDNTAENIEILINLPAGQSVEVATDALYLFTDCEVSYAPNACVIQDGKPVFTTVTNLLAHSTRQTTCLLEQELKLQQHALEEKLLAAQLEKIFIEKRIYREIEACQTWDMVIATIRQHLMPHATKFYRALTEDDFVGLTEIKIKRISQYDGLRAQERLLQLQDEWNTVTHHLQHIHPYAISWYKKLLEKYGKGHLRKSMLTNFTAIEPQEIAIQNQKLYVNRKEGFIGYGLKTEEPIEACSNMDDALVIRKEGICMVTKLADKIFVGKNILHTSIYKKSDTRRCYNLIYVDGATGISFVKRVQISGVTRDKPYDLTTGTPGTRIVYLSDNLNGEAETITIFLAPTSRASKKKFEFNFAQLAIKGRAARGNILTKYAIYKVQRKEQGVSTLQAVTLCYDPHTGRIMPNGRGPALGTFGPADQLLIVWKEGCYMVADYPLSFQLDPTQVVCVEKYTGHVLSIVYYNQTQKLYFVKRFQLEKQVTNKKYDLFVSEADPCTVTLVTSSLTPKLQLDYTVHPTHTQRTIVYDLEKIAIKTLKAKGTLLSKYKITNVTYCHE